MIGFGIYVTIGEWALSMRNFKFSLKRPEPKPKPVDRLKEDVKERDEKRRRGFTEQEILRQEQMNRTLISKGKKPIDWLQFS